ncbi:MAG: extracellular solute-binding protein [Hydrotalea sp.]|nr:extracellular solute-binding protein [Hydrotalea sp.]
MLGLAMPAPATMIVAMVVAINLSFAIIGQNQLARAATNAAANDAATNAADNYNFQHGYAILGQVKYPKGFAHFKSVNPNAPKTGSLTLASVGSFDSFNPYLLQGIAPSSIGLIYDTLMTGNGDDDDKTSQYGLIADGIYVSPDKRTIAFHINPKARFTDGVAITADDVVWTFNTLLNSTDPSYKSFYRDIGGVRAVGKQVVIFTNNNPSNRKIPNILGGLTVLPKHFWQDKDFNKPSLTVPLGSGPYRIKDFAPGEYLTYELLPNYWARDLNTQIGQNNYATMKFRFYRDGAVAFEAFKAGQVDIHVETIARKWATAYDLPAVKSGKIIKKEFHHRRMAPMQYIAFNLRKPLFAGDDGRALRHAMQLLWNFEWANDNLMYRAYTRTASLFDNSKLRATGRPSAAELDMLLPFKKDLPPEVFGAAYTPPDNSGDNFRTNMLLAVKILESAGFYYQGQTLYSPKKIPVEFTILLDNGAFIPVLSPLVQSAKRIGARVNLRVIDPSVLTRQLLNFNYDVTINVVGNPDMLGDEQRLLWGSEAAKQMGSPNLAGVQSPALDAVIDKLTRAQNEQEMLTAAHAMDRIIMWGYYFIPMYHGEYDRVAYWNKLLCPTTATNGFNMMACWVSKP